MHPSQRLVTTLPLTELWTVDGPVAAERGAVLAADTVRHLLSAGPVQFVVADVGRPLRWIPVAECYVAWKAEVRPHLVAEPERPIDVYTYPQGYAYVASAWTRDDPFAPPVILLERHH